MKKSNAGLNSRGNSLTIFKGIWDLFKPILLSETLNKQEPRVMELISLVFPKNGDYFSVGIFLGCFIL